MSQGRRHDPVPKARREPNDHVRRHVQRSAGTSGPVKRYRPGTAAYEELMFQERETPESEDTGVF